MLFFKKSRKISLSKESHTIYKEQIKGTIYKKKYLPPLKERINIASEKLLKLYAPRYSFEELIERLREIEHDCQFGVTNIQALGFGICTGLAVFFITGIFQFVGDGKPLFRTWGGVLSYLALWVGASVVEIGILLFLSQIPYRNVKKSYSHEIMLWLPFEKQIIINKLKHEHGFVYNSEERLKSFPIPALKQKKLKKH